MLHACQECLRGRLVCIVDVWPDAEKGEIGVREYALGCDSCGHTNRRRYWPKAH